MNPYLVKAVNGLGVVWARSSILNPGDIPVEDAIRGIPYVEAGHGKQRLDITVPPARTPRPALVYIHGGGWMNGDKNSYRRLCACYALAGYLTFNINYRLTPRYMFPSQLQDVAAALNWVYRNAERYGGDPSRIFLAGDSAGAHLSSWYAAALNDDALPEAAGIDSMIPRASLKGLLLYYGAYDMDAMLETGFPFMKTFYEAMFGREREASRQRAAICSPRRHLNAAYPPSFITCGGSDPLLSESRALSSALGGLGVAHHDLFFTAPEYRRVNHGFMSFHFLRSYRRAVRESIGFLDEHAV